MAKTKTVPLEVAETMARAAAADLFFRMALPHMVFDPGLGKQPMEFKPGSVDALQRKLAKYVAGEAACDFPAAPPRNRPPCDD